MSWSAKCSTGGEVGRGLSFPLALFTGYAPSGPSKEHCMRVSATWIRCLTWSPPCNVQLNSRLKRKTLPRQRRSTPVFRRGRRWRRSSCQSRILHTPQEEITDNVAGRWLINSAAHTRCVFRNYQDAKMRTYMAVLGLASCHQTHLWTPYMEINGSPSP
jgi:hypothetical protein